MNALVLIDAMKIQAMSVKSFYIVMMGDSTLCIVIDPV